MRRAALLVLLSVGLVACGDSTGPEDGELTQAEVDAMFEALAVIGAFDFDMGAAASAVPGGPAAVPVSETISETVPCPGGGSLVLAGSISGDVDEETGLGTVSFDLTHTHQGCTATAPSSGMTFTFDGDPDISVEADIVLSETSFSFSGAQTGGLEWRTGDRSGSCTVDVEFDLQISDDFTGEPTGTVTGTMCGRSVSETF